VSDLLTDEDMRIVLECATMRDKNAAMARLTEVFEPRGIRTYHAAAEAADKLTRYDEPVDIGNGEYAMRTRDALDGAPVTGAASVVRAVE
jgi:hypothetical protein